MNNTYIGARIKDYNTITIGIFSNYNKPDNVPINLVINDTRIVKLNIVKQSFLNGLVFYECKCNEKIELGNRYIIAIKNLGKTPLIVDDVTEFKNFDEEYYYSGDDLGATYNEEFTTFKIWAPLASDVFLLLRKNKGDNFQSYELKRGPKGVYSLRLDGDFDGYKYRYRIVNNGISIITTDPYAKGSTANGKDSCVINFKKTKVDLNESKLPKYRGALNSIIYELNVRDFTIQNSTDIKNKGKYLGLSELDRKTSKGNDCGLSYLKKLGVTHVQIMPFYDFKTVDELNPDSSYNRGYDPQQYFVPEGSYSLNPNDPYSRIIEAKTMIAALHNEGIRVVMDVVFNHVYEEEFSVFEKVVPNYYFRKRKDGTLSNGSFCGNDIETKHLMVKKMILDCIKYWIKEYGIDGFRFDLMGILDIETMNQIIKEAKEIKSDILIYGEGWNMPTELPDSEKCTSYNSFKCKDIGYFNDSFRDIIRGRNDGNQAGYGLGNTSFLEGFKFAFLGSTTNYCYPAKFYTSSQSINYVECHDNRTLFDVAKLTFGDDFPFKSILEYISLINVIIYLSVGVPFYHAGQEIGLTKFNDDNTYNKGDLYNQFDWNLLDERIDMVKSLASIFNAGKKLDWNALNYKEDIEKSIIFENLEYGALLVKVNCKKYSDKEFLFVINPTNNQINLPLDDYYRVIVSKAGANYNSKIYIKNLIIDPITVNVLEKNKDKNKNVEISYSDF